MRNKIKKEYRGLFNKKYAVDRKLIKLVKRGELDLAIVDLDTGRRMDNEQS